MQYYKSKNMNIIAFNQISKKLIFENNLI